MRSNSLNYYEFQPLLGLQLSGRWDFYSLGFGPLPFWINPYNDLQMPEFRSHYTFYHLLCNIKYF